MILSISAFLLIIRNLKSNEISAGSLRYFNIYFILGVVSLLFVWVKQSTHINVNLSLSLFLYVVTSCFLLLAINEFDGEKKSQRRIIIFPHALVAAGSLLLSNDSHTIIFSILYSSVVYFTISYISFKRLITRKNIGYTIIGSAALLVLVLIPIQIYFYSVRQDYSLVYGLIFIGSSAGFVLVGIGFLTTVLVAENKKLSRLAQYDPLTGLLNRRGMYFSLTHSIAASFRKDQEFSCINIDIDFFKQINDRYGHHGGDFVLKKISETLLTNVRPTDVCSRLGGEEFVIILPDTSESYAVSAAERIRVDIEKSEIMYMDKIIKLTSSFGVATHRKSIDIDYLLKDADKALYAAKEKGRNTVCIAISNQ
jgi:diguanylate cyclase (GGDEF)-like protein